MARSVGQRAHAVLHPQRLAVITQLAAGPKTVAQLAELLPDIAPATLYRHLRALAEAQVVVGEPASGGRGAPQTYRLPASAAALTMADLAGATAQQQLGYFTSFVASLIGQFDRYLQRGTGDYVRDGVGYRELVLHLSDVEFGQFTAALSAALAPFVAHEPAPGRTARAFATVVLPLESAPSGEHLGSDHPDAGRGDTTAEEAP